MLGIAGNSRFTGWVPFERVPSLLCAMDVVPLLEHDPQGGSIIREAMACGRVAMTVDGKSGTQSRFVSGNTGVLLSPARHMEDAVNYLADRRRECEEFYRLGISARRFAETHMSFGAVANAIVRAARVTTARLSSGS
jgi:glycosyltransferase involved in cell wall biosynthesis